MRRLQQLGGKTTVPSGDEIDALPRSTVSTILRGTKLPRSEFITAFVRACLVHAHQPPEKVAEAIDAWLTRWQALYAAEAAGTPAGTPGEGDPAGGTPEQGATPRHLPRDMQVLVGREAEFKLAEGVARPTSRENLVVVTGLAGIGKSAFAIRWAHQCVDHFPDGQLYVDLRSPHGPLAMEDALGVLLGGLGVPEATCPEDPQRRMGLYRSLVADKRLLVVLDNAADAEQVRPLLATGRHCRTIVTSRNRMSGLVARDGARRLILDVLSTEAACTLLTAIIGELRLLGARAEMEELAGMCAHLPLVLRLAAVKFADQPQTDFRDYVAALRDDAGPVSLALDGDGDGTVQAVMDVSYRRLAPDARRYFRMLGTAGTGLFTVTAGAALAGLSVAEARRLTGLLASEHLVTMVGRNRFTLHSVLRAYARTKTCAADGSVTVATARGAHHTSTAQSMALW